MQLSARVTGVIKEEVVTPHGIGAGDSTSMAGKSPDHFEELKKRFAFIS